MKQVSGRGAWPDVDLHIEVEFIRKPDGQRCPDLMTTGKILADGLVGVEVIVPCTEGQAVYRVANVRVVAYGPSLPCPPPFEANRGRGDNRARADQAD